MGKYFGNDWIGGDEDGKGLNSDRRWHVDAAGENSDVSGDSEHSAEIPLSLLRDVGSQILRIGSEHNRLRFGSKVG